MEPLTGVGATAIGVALIRARESQRPDRLYDDPYAAAFADAAREAYLDPAAPPGAATTWARIEELAPLFYEGRTVGVRLVDDGLLSWVAGGCEQVVILGAGLDTRAFRLPFPRAVRLFEIDLPAMFAFKEPVLDRLAATPTCDRRVVPADLRADWAAALVDAGFRDTVSTAWIEEGVLGYLPQAAAHDVVTKLTALSAPGSRFGAGRIIADETQPHYRELKQLVFRADTGQRPLSGLGPDAEELLNRLGWCTEFRGWDQLVEPLGRAVMTGNPDNGIIHAVRM